MTLGDALPINACSPLNTQVALGSNRTMWQAKLARHSPVVVQVHNDPDALACLVHLAHIVGLADLLYSPKLRLGRLGPELC